MTRSFPAVAAFIAATAMLQKAAAQDVDKGQRSFNKCLPCHAVGPGGQNKVGPELNGLDGRQAGTSANFSYSDANKNSGIVWNEATFKDYIRSPQAKMPGYENGVRKRHQPTGDRGLVGLPQAIRH
jgi:cytochrome c